MDTYVVTKHMGKYRYANSAPNVLRTSLTSANRYSRGGGDEFNDFVDPLGNLGELKHEKGMEEAISELKSLIQGHRVNSYLPTNTGISGALADRITKNVDLRKRKKIGNGLNWQNKERAEGFSKQNKNKNKEE